jgi:hypothetical protein
MTSIRMDLRAVRIIALALAIAAIAAPAASARFDLEPAHGQSTQTQQTAPVPPILHRVQGSQLAAANRAKEQALANHVPPNGRYSTADLNGYATVTAPAVKAPALSAPGNGFDWGDAAVGAGITAAIALMITAGSLAVRQRSQPDHP